ncbi:hypothetical protein K8I61_13125 [bacterium]|nr:hypothetical protein [bacterium]
MTKSTLTRFWRLLQSRSDLGDVEAVWRRDLREEWDAVRSFFKPTDSLAKSYPCPSPGDVNCPRRIVQHEHDRFAAFCGQSPPECDTLQLTRKDVIIHKFDVATFAKHLASQLQFSVRPSRDDSFWHLWRVGSYVPIANQAFPVFLSLAPDEEQFLRALDFLLADQTTPFILMTPSSEYLDDQHERMLNNHRSRLLPLNESIVWNGETLVASAPPADLLEVFRKRALHGGVVEPGHVAKLFSHEGCNGITKQEMDEILGLRKSGYDLIVDGIRQEIWYPKLKRKQPEKFRAMYHLKVLRELVERGAALLPEQFNTLSHIARGSSTDPDKAMAEQVQRTRSAIDPESKKPDYLYIKTVKVDDASTAYHFSPEPGLKYALIFPLESDS